MKDKVRDELKELEDKGFEIEVHEENNLVIVVVKQYELPTLYNMTHTDILFKIPQSYPNGKLDMFWVNPTLTLKNGKIGEAANTNEKIIDRDWRRYSWHPQKWNPGYDNILTFFEFIETRLAMEK